MMMKATTSETETNNQHSDPLCRRAHKTSRVIIKLNNYYIMTKKHFELVASLINAANQGAPASDLALLAVAKFEKDNPRFDAERFLTACGDPLAPPPDTINV